MDRKLDPHPQAVRILEYNGHVTRLAVEGGAGTGTMLVALEHARRLARSRQRVLMLCFNAALARGVADGVCEIEAIDVWSFNRL